MNLTILENNTASKSDLTHENKIIIELIEKLISDSKKKTGILVIRDLDDNSLVNIFIKENTIVYAKSNMHKTRIGQLLLKKKIIKKEQLYKALKIQSRQKEKLIGEILSELGYISKRTIPNLLFHQIETIIYESFSWKNIAINFEETSIDNRVGKIINLIEKSTNIIGSSLNKLFNPKAYIEEIKVNVIKLNKIRLVLDCSNKVPYRPTNIYPKKLSFDERKILRIINHKKSIFEIIILSHLSYLETYEILYKLLLNNYILLDENAKPDSLDKSNQKSQIKLELSDLNKNKIKLLKSKIEKYEKTLSGIDESVLYELQKLSFSNKMDINNLIKNYLKNVSVV